MRVLKVGAIALVVLLVIAQAFRIDRTNPPVTAEVDAPAPVREIMKRACDECHSNVTTWRWYSSVAPISWLIAYDVHEGREELNFSEWGRYKPPQRQKKLNKIREEVDDGEMPPWYYVYPMHLEARLSAADRETLFAWVASQSAASFRQAAH